jgi:hypothetical protein
MKTTKIKKGFYKAEIDSISIRVENSGCLGWCVSVASWPFNSEIESVSIFNHPAFIPTKKAALKFLQNEVVIKTAYKHT